jgi:hypothetical protein
MSSGNHARAESVRRRTLVSAVQPVAPTATFCADGSRAAQWRECVSRNNLPGAPSDFALVGEAIEEAA